MFLFQSTIEAPQKKGALSNTEAILQQAHNEVRDFGQTLSKKVIGFPTREGAEAFASRVKATRITFVFDEIKTGKQYYEDTEKLNPDKKHPGPKTVPDDYFVVSFQTGKGRQAADVFLPDVQEKKTAAAIKKPKTYIMSRGVALGQKPSGDFREVNPAEDKSFALSGDKPVPLNSRTREMAQTVVADLALAYQNYAKNVLSIETVDMAVNGATHNLAYKLGFDGQNEPVERYLASQQGQIFKEEFASAAKNGKFMIKSNASSEYLFDKSETDPNHEKYVLADLQKQMKNALDRGEIIRESLSKLLGVSLDNVQIVPHLHLIQEIPEAVRKTWIQRLSSEKKQTPEAVALKKWLETAYSDSEIAEHRQKVFGFLYSMKEAGDEEAVKAWNTFASKRFNAVQATEQPDGSILFKNNNVSSINTLLSLKAGKLRKTYGVVDMMLEQSNARAGEFEMKNNITLGLNVGDGVKANYAPGEKISVPLTVTKIVHTEKGESIPARFDGDVVVKAFEKGSGSEVPCELGKTDKGYSVSFTPQDGKKYAVIAYAKEGLLDSDRVKHVAEVGKKPEEKKDEPPKVEKHLLESPYPVQAPVPLAYSSVDVNLTIPPLQAHLYGGKANLESFVNAMKEVSKYSREMKFKEALDLMSQYVYDKNSESNPNTLYGRIQANPTLMARWADSIVNGDVRGFFKLLADGKWEEADKMRKPNSPLIGLKLTPTTIGIDESEVLLNFLQYQQKSHQAEVKFNLADNRNWVVNIFARYNAGDGEYSFGSMPFSPIQQKNLNTTLMVFSVPLQSFLTFGASIGEINSNLLGVKLTQSQLRGVNLSAGGQYDFLDSLLTGIRAKPELTFEKWWLNTDGTTRSTLALTPSLMLTTQDYIAGVVKPYYSGSARVTPKLRENSQFIGSTALGAFIKPFANADLGFTMKNIELKVEERIFGTSFDKPAFSTTVGITVPLGFLQDLTPGYEYKHTSKSR